jgi:hypothetical protein
MRSAAADESSPSFQRSAEELIQQFLATDAEMLGYIGEDPRKSFAARTIVVFCFGIGQIWRGSTPRRQRKGVLRGFSAHRPANL